MNNKLIAEAIGTFFLTFAVLGSLQSEMSVLATPVIAGLVLGLFVYSIGSISGCHINPAVTAGLWSIGKINGSQAVRYIIAQCFGAAVALGLGSFFFTINLFTFAPESFTVFVAEVFGTAIFSFGIAAVVYGKVADTAAGLVIGGSLLLGIIIAIQLGSAGILNPAVALGLGSLSVSYVSGAIIGAILGMRTYRHITT